MLRDYLPILLLTVLALGGGDWAVNLILRKINPWPATALRAADVTGNLLTAPRLYRLSLTRADGEVMLRADSAAVRYDLRRLVAGDITLAEITDECWGGRHRALFLGGGPTVEDCIRRIEAHHLRQAGGVVIVPSCRDDHIGTTADRGGKVPNLDFTVERRCAILAV